MPERSNLLRLAIFKYGESVLVQIGDHMLFVIDDGSVQYNLLHFGMKNEGTRRLPLGLRRSRARARAVRRGRAGGGRALLAGGIGLCWLRATRGRLGRGRIL